MAPSNPKRPPRRGPPAPAPKRRADVELPFDDQELTPLKEDDPRPQRVPQYPATGRKPARRQEDAEDSLDRALSSSYREEDVGDPGFEPAFLYVERGPGAGQLVPIRQGVLLIGRASTSGLRLQHPSISRRHAQLNRKGERFFIRDLASQNGTYVNQVRLEKEIEIFPGDELVMGTAQLRLRGPGQTGARRDDESTPHSAHSGGASVTGIALTAGVVGFGLAAIVMFAWIKLSRGPVYENLGDSPRRPAKVVVSPPRQPPPPPEAVAEVPKAPAPPPPAAAAKAEEAPPPRTAEPAPKAEAPGPAHEDEAAALTPPEPQDEAPKAQTIALRAQPPKKTSKTTVAKASAASEDEEPQATSGRSEPAVLARYESGNVGAAIELAKKRNARELVAQLSRFQTLYEAAQRALTAQDQAGALKNLDGALKLDERISSGWGKYNADLRKQLSGLHTMAGMRLVSSDPAGAQRELSAALKYDPENEAAKAQLQKLNGASGLRGSGKSTTGKPKGEDSPRSAIDAAFGN